MKKLVYIVQARMGSTRLPGKILRPLYKGKSILDLQIEKLTKGISTNQIIIATSVNAKDDVLARYGMDNNLEVYRGSENDVLSRFVTVMDRVDATHCVRICADNPFLNTSLLEQVLSYEEADYVSHHDMDGSPAMQTHIGIFSEYVSKESLERIRNTTVDPLYREHVTNYIYSHPDNFDIRWIDMPKGLGALKNVRLTVDTQEDFTNVQEVLQDLKEEGLDNLELLTSYLVSNKKLRANMEKQIIRNGK